MGGRAQACHWPRHNIHRPVVQEHALEGTTSLEQMANSGDGNNNNSCGGSNQEWSRILVRAVGVTPQSSEEGRPHQDLLQHQIQNSNAVHSSVQQQHGCQSKKPYYQHYQNIPQQFTYNHQLNYHEQLSYQQQLQRYLMMRRQQSGWPQSIYDAGGVLREEEWVVDGSDVDEGSERTEYMDPSFVRSLRKDPTTRNQRDLQAIFVGLRGLSCPALPVRDSAALRALSQRVRYERRHANDILYYTGEAASCWYILLSGSVFIDGSMFLPRSSFGKRTGGGRRPNDCFVLEPSEMMVIDYPEAQPSGSTTAGPGLPAASTALGAGHTFSSQPSASGMNHERGVTMAEHRRGHSGGGDASDHERQFSSASSSSSSGAGSGAIASSNSSPSAGAGGPPNVGPIGGGGLGSGRPELYQRSNRSSHSSDTSSAYSGSDAMQSVQSSLDADEVDLSGLVESVVDSDEEEDLAESIDSLTVRDTVRECLEKDPSERVEEDIEILLEFTQHLKAFTNMTLAVRRALCSVMVFAVVEKSSTIVMNDGEELDSWSVLINGHVEVEMSSGESQQLHLGDSFGITPTMEKLHHKGIMRTRCDDCQFVCITQADYYRILHQGEENTRRHEEGGTVVMVTEQRGGGSDGSNSRRGHIVIRGTPERLMLQLIEENSLIDPTYVEDFLLTHRSFIESPIHVASQLLQWFNNPGVKDRVTRVVLLWVNNHFTDFETDPVMMAFLEEFEVGLEREKMQGQLRLLNIACAAKARKRTVTLARPTRDEVLHFSILGGYERGFGIFISKVEKSSKAEDVGLKRGDQVLEVNGQSFEHVSHAKALEVLRGTTHLSITVKSNLLAFKEMLQTPENSPRPRGRKASEIARLQDDPRARLSSLDDSTIPANGSSHSDGITVPISLHAASPCKIKDASSSASSTSSSSSSSSHKGFRGIRNALIKISMLPRNAVSDRVNGEDGLGAFAPGVVHNPVMQVGGNATCGNGIGVLPHSRSNPDLAGNMEGLDPHQTLGCPDYPEHVLKVYKPDQTCKYLLVHKETTAHEVVMLALQEFGLTDPSSHFSLCEVSVTEQGIIKQRRLPDTLQNLAERIGLSSRYYLKTNGSTETLVPDELAPELIRESQVHFLQLNAVEVATQLTLQDFSIFRQIESTEYVDDLFELKSRYGTPMLSQFAELVNREMFWVVTEVCSESNPVRRSKIIKQFIKVARQCKECKNFNSMFAIISGLGHGAVSRLRQTWEKLPSKYHRLFSDLQDLMDPSRNMSKYRQLVSSEQSQPPIIPFYPVVKKDLTFIHLGNDSRVEGGLVNFEKLRMIAKEVRTLTNMCSSPYDLMTMLERGGQQPSSAMVALNQLTTGATHPHHSQPHSQGSTVKRRKKSTATPNPKKMFEEAQMVRRVKAYLNNMKVISDEDKLHALSSECEPGPTSGVVGSSSGTCSSSGGGSAPSSVPVRKRHPSPTLSTASSTSSTSEGKRSISAVGPAPSIALGPKFGAASPQAVRKMLALSEPKTRPHQPRHPPAPPPPPGGLPPSGGATFSHPPLAFMPLHHMHHHHHHHLAHHQQGGGATALAPHLPFTSLQHSHHMASTLSPTPSPGPHRRAGVSGRATHERSHSDTPTTTPSAASPLLLPQPVDLSAESSSVTSLSNLPNLRKAHNSGRSRLPPVPADCPIPPPRRRAPSAPPRRLSSAARCQLLKSHELDSPRADACCSCTGWGQTSHQSVINDGRKSESSRDWKGWASFPSTPLREPVNEISSPRPLSISVEGVGGGRAGGWEGAKHFKVQAEVHREDSYNAKERVFAEPHLEKSSLFDDAKLEDLLFEENV